MSDAQQNAELQRQREAGARRHIAGLVALVAVFAMVAAWFWMSHQPAPPNGVQAGVEAGYGMPHGVMVIGAGALVAALISRIRSMSVSDILEAVWELFLGMLSAIGLVLKGIWDWFLGLIGWH